MATSLQPGATGAPPEDYHLTAAELEKYERDGWVIKRNVFTREECERLIAHMKAVHDDGAPDYPPSAKRLPSDWNGWGQPHLYDKTISQWMLDQRLRAPLSDVMGGDEPEGIKSYWWFKVQEGFTRRHCDGTALPKCTGVWIPMCDVDGGVEVGTLGLQTGSHRGRRVDHDSVQRSGRVTTHSSDGSILGPLVTEIYGENERNGCQLDKVVARAGDAVIFHGHLFHHAVFGNDPERFRQVLACHYIPAGYTHWPHVLWERVAFDGTCRWSDGTDVETAAAYVNARLPPHPLMAGGVFGPSIFPARREGLRRCTNDQVTELDRQGYTVLRAALHPDDVAQVKTAFSQLELAPHSRHQGLVSTSPLLRHFCSNKLFQDLIWDCLHVDTGGLVNDSAESGAPVAFHQANGHKFSDPLQMLTCWAAITDDLEGSLRVIPKLHRRGVLKHASNGGADGKLSSNVTIPGLREDDAVSVPLQSGDVAVFWSLTPYAVVAKTGVQAYSMQFAIDGTLVLQVANGVAEDLPQRLVLKDGARAPADTDARL